MLLFIISGCTKNDMEIQYYKNGNIKLKAELENGKRQGKLYDYYKDGSLKAISEWDDGRANGLVKHYYPEGQLAEETMWEKDEVNGITKEYYRNGQLKKIARKKGDLFIGEVFFYYENGQIKEHRVHDSDGKLVYIGWYDEVGFKHAESVIPIFKPEKDTISINEIYNVKVEFGVPLKGNVRLLTGEFDKEGDLIDTISVFNGDKNEFHFSIKPEKLGLNVLSVLVSHQTEKGDTLSANGVVVKHTFYVKEE